MTIKKIHDILISKALELWPNETKENVVVRITVEWHTFNKYSFECSLFSRNINMLGDPMQESFYTFKSPSLKGLFSAVDELIYGKITNNVSVEEDLKIEENGSN